MRRLVTAIVAISAVAAGAAAGGAIPAGAATASGGFGTAVGVPGLFNLNKGGGGGVSGVSCVSAGSCTAAGTYFDAHHAEQGFAVSEQNGRWGKAIEIPGLGKLNAQGGEALVGPVACGSAGNCTVGGAYAYDGTGFRFSSFIATEHDGKWSKAVSLERDGDVYSISCPSGGNCVAAGGATSAIGEYYLIGDAFVKEQSAGSWGPIKFIPGLLTLEGNGDPEISGSWTTSVDCLSPGNCTAGGAYLDKNGAEHGFVAAETKGVWGSAIEVPGLAALNTAGDAEVNSVSCDHSGTCVAGGYYSSSGSHGFVAVETNGVWGQATEVPGLATLNTGGSAEVTSVSCSSADCAALGTYQDSKQHRQVFVATEKNGAWGKAIEVPGLAALNTGSATVGALSCGSSGCAAGGSFVDRSHHDQGFVVLERNGTWGKATLLHELAVLNQGGHAAVASVSCPSQGSCTAGGSYIGRHHLRQSFVTTPS